MALIPRALVATGLKLGSVRRLASMAHHKHFAIPLQHTNGPKLQFQLRPLCRTLSTEENAVDVDNAEAAESAEKPAEKKINPIRDRSKVIPVETSLRYMESAAYKETYGDEPVWKPYRRNFKGQFAPRLTRKKCIRKDILSTGNPCPICRDEYLVVDYRNVKLLKQFISPHTGEVYEVLQTGVCREKQLKLRVEIEKAIDRGYITTDVPFREYDYSDYYDFKEESKSA